MPTVAAVSRSRERLSWADETVRGVPNANPVFYKIPHESGSVFNQNQTFARSDVIEEDRLGGVQVGGHVDETGRLVMPVVNETAAKKIFQSCMSSTFAQVALTVTAAYATNGTITRSAGSFLTDPLASRLRVGDKIAIAHASQGSTLNEGATLTATDTTITLTSAANFPTAGEIQIESEWIRYTGKSSNDLTGCTRGYRDTTAATHADATAVYPVRTIASITALVVTTSEAGITQAAVSVILTTNRFMLQSGTTRAFGSIEDFQGDAATPFYDYHFGVEVNTMEIEVPNEGEVKATINFVGLGTPVTSLTLAVGLADTTITVGDTTAFPTAGGFAIDEEEITYTGKTSTTLTGCTRGANSTTAAEHPSGSGLYLLQLISGATYVAKAGNKPTAGSVPGSTLLLDDVELGGVETMSISLNNRRAARYVVGSRFGNHVEEGTFDAEATAQVYLSNQRLKRKFNSGTRFKIEIVSADQARGQRWIFTFYEALFIEATKAESGETLVEQYRIFGEKNQTLAQKFSISYST